MGGVDGDSATGGISVSWGRRLVPTDVSSSSGSAMAAAGGLSSRSPEWRGCTTISSGQMLDTELSMEEGGGRRAPTRSCAPAPATPTPSASTPAGTTLRTSSPLRTRIRCRLSIIVGVLLLASILGLMCSLLNALHFRLTGSPSGAIAVCLKGAARRPPLDCVQADHTLTAHPITPHPSQLLLLSIFGYLVFCIFYKWSRRLGRRRRGGAVADHDAHPDVHAPRRRPRRGAPLPRPGDRSAPPPRARVRLRAVDAPGQAAHHAPALPRRPRVQARRRRHARPRRSDGDSDGGGAKRLMDDTSDPDDERNNGHSSRDNTASRRPTTTASTTRSSSTSPRR